PLNVRIVVHDAPCPLAERACSIGGTPDVYIQGFQPDVFLHEMGHQFDYAMTDRARTAFERITHDSRPWRSPPNSPHEQWAEAYRLCAQYGDQLPAGASAGYLYPVGKRVQRQVCALIGDEAARDGFTPNPTAAPAPAEATTTAPADPTPSTDV